MFELLFANFIGKRKIGKYAVVGCLRQGSLLIQCQTYINVKFVLRILYWLLP